MKPFFEKNHYWNRISPSRYFTACGEGIQTDEWISKFPNKVTCSFCKETEQFKHDLILFEVGYDGDLEKWEDYVDNIR